MRAWRGVRELSASPPGPEQALLRAFLGQRSAVVLHKGYQLGVLIFPYRLFQGNGMTGYIEQPLHLARLDLDLLGDLFWRRPAAVLLLQLIGRPCTGDGS